MKLLQPEGALGSRSAFIILQLDAELLLVSSLHLQLHHQFGSIGLGCSQLSCGNIERMASLLGMPRAMQKAWRISTGMHNTSKVNFGMHPGWQDTPDVRTIHYLLTC